MTEGMLETTLREQDVHCHEGVQPVFAAGLLANGLALRLYSRVEAVDLEASGDPDDAGLFFAGGEVACLLGGPRAGTVGTLADEEAWVEDLEQERGQGQLSLVRGGNPP